MADFQPIVAGIFEKDRVVARAFDIPRASPTSFGLFASESDPAFVGDMPCRLGDAKQLSRTIRSGGFELEPVLDADVPRKPQRNQKAAAILLSAGQVYRSLRGGARKERDRHTL